MIKIDLFIFFNVILSNERWDNYSNKNKIPFFDSYYAHSIVVIKSLNNKNN